MIRIGIAEDDRASAKVLLSYLSRYQDEHDVTLAVHAFGDGSDLLDNYRSDYDILFLDVEMPQMDGFEVAHRVRAFDTEVVIIFITHLGQLAVKGYEVDALSYLVKPVTYFSFEQELDRSLARLRQRDRRSVAFSVDRSFVRLDPAEIIYVESDRHRITVHAIDRRYTFSGTLKAMEEDLDGLGFVRSNNCYLVNLRHVKRIDQSTSIMSNGDQLRISRPRKRDVLEALADHVGGRVG
ncbi:MAG: LytR/AlgR family response regulator transcription factor [Beutenbergiaceae bacterium]